MASKFDYRKRGLQAVATKLEQAQDELVREGRMAAWTRKHGKNDAKNPWSKQNYKFVKKNKGT
jgi:hypothetical protein